MKKQRIVILALLTVALGACVADSLATTIPAPRIEGQAETQDCQRVGLTIVCEFTLRDGTRCAVSYDGGLDCDWSRP